MGVNEQEIERILKLRRQTASGLAVNLTIMLITGTCLISAILQMNYLQIIISMMAFGVSSYIFFCLLYNLASKS